MLDINPNRPDRIGGDDRALSLSDFAQLNHMTEDRVWELIEEGELAARFVNDEILILREQDSGSGPRVDPIEAPESLDQASPLLAGDAIVDLGESEPAPSPEVDSGQQDFPSHAGDDHRDLLLFAQDAMNRTMDLSRQLLATKDELIRMKDEKILQQQTELQRNADEMRRLKKKIEDLETLCRMAPRI